MQLNSADRALGAVGFYAMVLNTPAELNAPISKPFGSSARERRPPEIGQFPSWRRVARHVLALLFFQKLLLGPFCELLIPAFREACLLP